ncbi:MAG: hypothetical protein Q9220_006754 [cf. Caloplaca sp. 1 TL-2023]
MPPIDETVISGPHASKAHVKSSSDFGTPQRRHAVTIIHNEMTATMAEDWILYPEETVIAKNSSIRKRESERLCTASCVQQNSCAHKAIQSSVLSARPDSSSAQIRSDAKGKKNIAHGKKASRNPASRPTSEVLDPAVQDHYPKERKSIFPYRLPTPDLSDVDEDEMWSCCTVDGRDGNSLS